MGLHTHSDLMLSWVKTVSSGVHMMVFCWVLF